MEGDRTYQLKGGERPKKVELSEYSAEIVATGMLGTQELESLENYADRQETNPEPYNIGNAVIVYKDDKGIIVKMPESYLEFLDDFLRPHY